ncbi:MAG: MotA/TolQ/ExbB proton channel family protein [Bacteroidales bacterium]|jgi:biopolymer transport protein ExbB|nr:MotA/TolQ/ExbB proton channel family protein [Bacteroidales bacterium]MBP5418631.1 MotA/TolQ/ExbB proton channel family protein [Bacteroidales bacterium]MCR5696302.1 MotA/TolQ/ExbB proton channel family protein [Marinilabiliaceae bacterium]
MKKLFAYLAVFGMMSFGSVAMAQDEAAASESASVETTEVASAEAETEEVAADEEVSIHKALKQKFVEGGVGWMLPVLVCIVLGLAISIERIIYLTLANSNTKKLIANVEEALNEGGVEKAKEVCRNTRGPVASIFYQGLLHYDEGVDMVEKTIVSYGAVQSGQMESGLTWISLFIALSPSLGFMGTVVGMIGAFDSIQKMGDISPIAVAGGIKVALLTTLFGLIAAVILQVFYNYIVVKIEGITNKMEEASISLTDMLVKYNKSQG